MDYLFSSKRLGFRLVEMGDLPFLRQLDGNKDVRYFFPTGPLDSSEIIYFIKRNRAMYRKLGISSFILTDLNSGYSIGRAGFDFHKNKVEVHYLFLQKYWGRGYAKEALYSLLDWAHIHIRFTDKIFGFTPVNHIISQKIMENCGMSYYGNKYYKGVDCRFYEWLLRKK